MNPPRSRGVFEEKVSAEEAFEAFVSEMYGRIVVAARVVVSNQATAEDIAQEAFARLYLNWSKLWPDGNPKGWVYRVTTNLAISWRRRLTREVRAVARFQKWTDQTSPAPEAYPELHRAVAGLPPGQRAAVALHYVLGLSMEECGEALGCAAGTVKSRLHAAREALRKELGKELVDE